MKKFISPYGWFSINYPDSWFEFEDEEGSFLFYNPNRWTGNLRVSAFKDNSRNYAHQMLEEEQKNYPNAYLKNIGGWDSVITKEDFTEGGQEYTSYIYLLGKANTVLEFSFTVSKGVAPDDAEQVISSLIIRDERKPYPKEIIPVRVWEVHQVDEAFDWVSKTVKKSQKKDFTGSYEDIAKLQCLIDSGIYPPGQRETWEAIGIAFGVILTNEMDGMEWVTVVDGKNEYPALQFAGTDFYLEPMKYLSEAIKHEDNVDLTAKFDSIKREIESKL
ncbi:MAG: DUF3805 domain-containing protein [Bacteroidaceae bacterium]|nr:DUF3805 domain-containing protein [Bacteroidaceae bacterium]